MIVVIATRTMAAGAIAPLKRHGGLMNATTTGPTKILKILQIAKLYFVGVRLSKKMAPEFRSLFRVGNTMIGLENEIGLSEWVYLGRCRRSRGIILCKRHLKGG